MKEFRAKVVVISDEPSLCNIVNHNFNEGDKVWIWKLIQNSFPGLKKEIEVFRRSNPRSRFYDGKEVITYDEESIYTNKNK